MFKIHTYLVGALLVAATLAEDMAQQQWTPYNMNVQGYGVDTQQDQQLQASDLSGGYDFGGHGGGFGGGQDFGGHDFGGGQDFGGHGFGGGQDFGHGVQSFPVHQHIEEETPEPIKHYKEVVVPVPKNVEFKINQPVIIPVPQPIPIQVPVPKAVVIPVIKEVSVPVEKSVPYPVEKHVHVPRIREVPFKVIKHILVPVEKPIPFKVPVYETIIHTKKGGSYKI